MNESIIDLCDSDDDNDKVASQQSNAAKRSTNNDAKYDDDDSSTSSSSSGDSHLWSAGGFLKGSPQRKNEEKIKATKRGNYFKEVRSNCGDDSKRKAESPKSNVGGASAYSPIVSLEIDDDVDAFEGGDCTKSSPSSSSNDSEGAPHQKKQSSNDRKIKKRQYSPRKSSETKKSSSQRSPNRKQSKIAAKKDKKEVECIEIDLSDSSDDEDGTANKDFDSEKSKKYGSFKPEKKNISLFSKPSSKPSKAGKDDDSESSDSDFDRDFQIHRRKAPTSYKSNIPNPYNKKTVAAAAKKKSYDMDDDSSYSSDSTVPLPEKKNQPANQKPVQNPYKANHSPAKKKAYESDDDSSHFSDSAVSLPDDNKSPAMKEHSKHSKKKNNGKGRVSFNNSDDIQFINQDGGADFSFDDGDFDEDDAQPSPKTKHAINSKKETGKQPSAKLEAKPKKQSALKVSLKDNVEVLDLDSDSDSSSSSAELFTPRPFKKKEKKPALSSKLEQSKTNSDEKKKCPNSSSSAKLLTPCAFSPATTSPTLGTYSVKRKVPTPAIPAMSGPLVKEIGGKLYPDLRHNFLVVLTSHARKARHNSYQRATFDSALRSIVVISLHMRPLRSAEATKRLKGVGTSFYDMMKESIAGQKGKKPFTVAAGKFSAIAPAALVACLELEEASASKASANGMSFPMEDLIKKINDLIDPRANASLNQSAEKYLDPNNLDPGWGQIKKLASTNAAADLGGPFIKERKKKDACASGRIYELLDSGRDIAKKLRDFARLGPAEPGPLRQLPDETVDEEFGNVTMSMDFREGGGSGKGLHRMCDQLDIRGVPYVVRELKIADYIFFVGDKLAPILIERKTAEDVASSIHDGRWERQQCSMRKAQYVLGGGPPRRCQICYIIEGDPNKKKVHGGNVGRRTYFQSVEDVEHAVEQLPSLGFSVMKSKGHLDTIGILAKIAQDVSWKAKNGSIEASFTYKQFLTRVKHVGDELGDPPTEREHQNPAPPVVVNAEPEPLSNSVDEGDICSPQADPVQENTQPIAPNMQTSQKDNSEAYTELSKLSLAKLKERCKERDEKIGGKKDELIARLLKPRKPELLIMRARRKEYVPKIPSSNAALLLALLQNHVPGTQGMAKERLMVLAEETGVSKESMSGDGGFYDGWSGMNQLQTGDPALVRREKGHRYSLTTQPPETSGRAVAHALHILAHREGLCTCGNPPPE